MKTPQLSFRLIAAIALLSILGGLIPLRSVFGQTQTVQFTAVADAHVNKSNPSRNYGTRLSLSLDGSPVIRTFLRFDVRNLNGARITGAKLRLYVVDDSDAGFNVVKVSNTTWKESTITFSTAPALGSQVGQYGTSYGANRWIEINLTGAVTGEGLVSLALRTGNNVTTAFAARETGANAPQLVLTLDSSTAPTATTAPQATAIPTNQPTVAPTLQPTTAPTPSSAQPFIVVGDTVDCENTTGTKQTSDLILSMPGTVQLLGDNVYNLSTYQMHVECFEPTYGRFKDRIRPAIGNHEYKSAADGYSRYFGAQGGPAGKFYYSYNVGKWHVVVLNSNCTEVPCQAGSAQEQWLKADLAANPALCTMAVFHHPRFSSGTHGNNTFVGPFWQALYTAGVDLVFNGHDHNYERFAPMDPTGKLDTARGIRQFVVGTGGIVMRDFVSTQPNSEKRIANVFGVLSLNLKDSGYDWKFLPVGGATATDSGSGVCH